MTTDAAAVRPMLPVFRLEEFFSHWEFNARHHLTASDAQTMRMADLLALAGDEDRAAWEDLALGYTQTFGDPVLREEIARTFDALTAADVLCFGGAQEGLYLVMQTLLQPGDHAVVITPCYQSAETVAAARCEVTGVALDADAGWALDLDAVRAALRPDTRLIAVNFPNNPTGAVAPQEVWRELAEECDRRGIWLFSDEVYRGLELDDARRLPQAADLTPRGISLNVTSKSLGLPGLRIGWIGCRDAGVIAALERSKHYTTICNSAPSEVLARIALRNREAITARNRAIIAENLPLFDAFFAARPDLFAWAPPDGGCVAYPRWTGPVGVEEFCARLVTEAGVLLLPSSVYSSTLTPVPTDRFRVGVGRLGAGPALDAWDAWLTGQGW